MNTLLALGQNAFEWTWKTSVSAALLVALVFLAQKLLSRWLTPRLRYTLSLLILIRLLIPVVPSSPFSFENLFRLRAAPVESASAPASTERSSEAAAPARLTGNSPGVLSGILPRISSGIFHGTVAHAPGLSVRAWISVVWAGGILCLVMLACWRYRQWKRILAQGEPISDPQLLELLESARHDMGVRRPVKLVAVARLSSPAVFGFWRVCLRLPQRAASQFSAGELRMIFLHEMAHVRRHDIGLSFVLIAVQFLHWFNPLVWLAQHRIRADRELVCDAMTLSRLPVAERPHYGQVLLKLMDGFPVETLIFPGAVPVIGSKQDIRRRLIMIKNYGRRSVGAGLATALAVAVLACATFTRAQEGAAVARQQAATGTNALPDLMRMLRQLEPSADERRARALDAIVRLGPAGKPALRDILPLVTNENRQIKIKAIVALESIGAIEDGKEQWTMRLAAINALAALRPPPPEAAPIFLRLLNDSNLYIRVLAIDSLVDQTNPIAIPVLNRWLHDKDSFIVTEAAMQIGVFGAAASASEPRLRELLDAPLLTVRQAATNSLAAITGQSLSYSAADGKADISYNLQNMPFEQFLDIYEDLAGKKVTIAARPNHNTALSLLTVRPLTKSEAMQCLEEVLKEQAGLVIVHGPDGSLTAVAKPQDSPH